jgi:HSP20 family protein
MIQQRHRVPAFGLVDMSREMDRLMDALRTDSVNGVEWAMPAEIIETADEIRIDLEVPGFREEDLDITLENHVLTIAGEKKMQRDEQVKDSDYRLAERRYGRFQRSFSVPATVRADRCEATYEHGVLTLRMPKVEEAKPRRIRVGSGSSNGRNLDEGNTL